MLQLEKCELGVLKVRTAKLWEVGGVNMPVLQAFISIYASWFSQLIIIDGSIIDDTFKKLGDIDAMLIEKND